MGLRGLRPGRSRGALRAVLPVRLVAHDRPGVQHRRQVVPRGAGRAVPVRRVMTASALVTGGGSGIGRAIAHALAREGYDVCVTGRRLETLERVADEVGGIAVAADVTDPAEVQRAIDA